MSGLLIRNFTGATSVHYHSGIPYDVDGAVLVSQGLCIEQSYAAAIRSSTNGVGTNDTDYQVLATVTVPGGTMGPNSRLEIITNWDYTSSASVKTLAMDWGGLNVSGPTYSTTASVALRVAIMNANSLTAQKILNGSTFASPSGTAHISATSNTANDVAIDFKVKWGANVASESITLIGYSIWHYPGS